MLNIKSVHRIGTATDIPRKKGAIPISHPPSLLFDSIVFVTLGISSYTYIYRRKKKEKTFCGYQITCKREVGTEGDPIRNRRRRGSAQSAETY